MSTPTALSFDLRWTPNDLAGPCLEVGPHPSPDAGCGTIAYDPSTGGIVAGDSAEYAWRISPAGVSVVQLLVSGGACSDRPASFCLSAVRVKDAEGTGHETEILSGATILGGDSAGCPVAINAATPAQIPAGVSTTLELRGADFTPSLSAVLLTSAGTLAAEAVIVRSAGSAAATFAPTAAMIGEATLVVATSESVSDTLGIPLSVLAPPPLPYDEHSIVVTFPRNSITFPEGVSTASLAEIQTNPPLIKSRLSQVGALALVPTHPASYLASSAVPLQDSTLLDIYRVDLADTNVVGACASLAADPELGIMASPNYLYRPASPPRDHLFPNQWWAYNTGQFGGVPGEDIRALAAWSFDTGSVPDTIAVLDTGCDANNRDLMGRVYFSPQTYPPGFPNTDDYGHGTSVAGIIAAAGDNFLDGPATPANGTAGINWNARILSVRAANADGITRDSDVQQAVNWIRTQGVRTLNFSYGIDAPGAFVRATETVFREAYRAGVLTTIAAGNSGGTAVTYPARYQPYVLAVGAWDYRGRRWDDRIIDWEQYNQTQPSPSSASNHGTGLFMVAPGGRFIETAKDPRQAPVGYQEWNVDPYVGRNGFGGTSAAAPMVAGAGSLLRSYSEKQLDNDDLKELLRRTVRPVGTPGWHAESGWGVLNLAAPMDSIRNGMAVEHGTITGATSIAQLASGSVSVNSHPTIPNGTYTAVRHTLRASAPLPAQFVYPPMCWTRLRLSSGTQYLPSTIRGIDYSNLGDNPAVIRWEPWDTVTDVTTSSLTCETYTYRLTDTQAPYASYWWPMAPEAATFHYTAIGMPASVLAADPMAASSRLSARWRQPVAREMAELEIVRVTRGNCSLEIFDLGGRRIVSKELEPGPAGVSRFVWNLRGDANGRVQPGLFWARATQNGHSATARLVVLQ